MPTYVIVIQALLEIFNKILFMTSLIGVLQLLGSSLRFTCLSAFNYLFKYLFIISEVLILMEIALSDTYSYGTVHFCCIF